MLEDAAQGEFDLGAAKVERKHRLVPAIADERLFGQGVAPQAVQVVAAGQVVGATSDLLYECLAGVYAGFGFARLGDDMFRDLVVSPVVEPTSLLDVSPGLGGDGQVGRVVLDDAPHPAPRPVRHMVPGGGWTDPGMAAVERGTGADGRQPRRAENRLHLAPIMAA